MGRLINISPYAYPGISIDHVSVMQRVCSIYKDITPDMLMDHTHKRKIVEPRQLCIYLMRKDLKLTLQDIQQKFNFKTHAAVMHSIEAVEKLLATNKEYRNKTKSLI